MCSTDTEEGLSKPSSGLSRPKRLDRNVLVSMPDEGLERLKTSRRKYVLMSMPEDGLERPSSVSVCAHTNTEEGLERSKRLDGNMCSCPCLKMA